MQFGSIVFRTQDRPLLLTFFAALRRLTALCLLLARSIIEFVGDHVGKNLVCID